MESDIVCCLGTGKERRKPRQPWPARLLGLEAFTVLEAILRIIFPTSCFSLPPELRCIWHCPKDIHCPCPCWMKLEMRAQVWDLPSLNTKRIARMRTNLLRTELMRGMEP